MQHCLTLAKKGLGKVAPNPMVGCVLVHNETIIAEGYHQQYGGFHAEPNAINQINDDVLKECSLYVTLEPCSHHGKTPPCADLIISKGIKKVVVGNLDTNPLVAGKGIKKLQDAGVHVEYSVLDKACRELNKRFFTFHEKKRPYIILKWAQTQDGFISHWPLPEEKESNWITSPSSKALVHQWRSEEQAILVGYNTALNDNPLLTTRLTEGKNPLRILLDEHLQLPSTLNVFNNEAETIVFNAKEDGVKNNIQFIKIDFKQVVPELLKHLYSKNISSLIIEGGSKTLELFINQQLWDEARVFVNPTKTFGNGIKAPKFDVSSSKTTIVGGDILHTLIKT